jgi:hypothetical protein
MVVGVASCAVALDRAANPALPSKATANMTTRAVNRRTANLLML